MSHSSNFLLLCITFALILASLHLIAVSASPTQQHPIAIPSDDATNDLACISCNLVLGGVLTAVKNNATMQKIEEVLHNLCREVDFCHQFVDKVTQILPYIARLAESQDYNAKDLCSMINYCTVDCCLTDSTPEQVHLGLNEFERASVAWTTRQKVCSEVQIQGITRDSATGKEQIVYADTVKGFERTYTNGGWRGWMHFVRDLGPSTLVHRTDSGAPVTHRYRVGCSQQNSWSQWFDMRAGVSDARNIVVLGDMGMENSDTNLQRIQQHLDKIDLIIIVGDQSYADGNQRKWDEFLRKFEPIFARRPLITITGNHEVGIIGLPILDIAGYPHRFLVPNIDMTTIPVKEGAAWYYSFNFGPLHFVAIDSEATLDLPLITDAQIDFINADLHKVNRTETPFIVAMAHRPFYCTQKKGTVGACDDNQMGYMRGKVESLFAEYKVDLILGGHRHNMERAEVWYKKGTPEAFTTQYIVNGAGGNRESMQGFGDNPPEYSKFRLTGERGYAFLSWNTNATVLTWQQFTSAKDVLVDAVEMHRR